MKTSPYWSYEFIFAGQRIRAAVKTTRKTIAIEAEKCKRLEMERANAGLPQVTSAARRVTSVANALKAYQEGYSVGHRPRSVEWLAERAVHVARLLGAALVHEVNEDRIRTYMKTRLAEGAGNRTINMEVACLSRAIGHPWRVLWPKVRALEEPISVGRALSPDEEQSLLDESVKNRSGYIHPFVYIALSTAMRYSEIRTLRWSQIDLKSRVITVRRAKSEGGTGRMIPMSDNLTAVIEMHRDWCLKKLKATAVEPAWCVFPFSSRVKPIDPLRSATTIKTAWEAVREKAKVSCRFHDLRHTTLTKWAEAGTPESTMLALAGHMSRKMLERYSHIRMAAKREAIKGTTVGTPSESAVPQESTKLEQNQNTAISKLLI
jgi:integrase